GEPIKEIAPSAPALVIGFETLPQAGEAFSVIEALKETVQGESSKTSPREKPGEEFLGLRLILKASDGGSLEALSEIVKSLAKEKPVLRVLGESVGDVNDNDVKFAISSKAAISRIFSAPIV
ncbi:MAG: hypothetical protein HYT79_11820, partial [Elusimicrobia bacterium]|nr:hypothetical protein [Elusimicrobiota bacterium]